MKFIKMSTLICVFNLKIANRRVGSRLIKKKNLSRKFSFAWNFMQIGFWEESREGSSGKLKLLNRRRNVTGNIFCRPYSLDVIKLA